MFGILGLKLFSRLYILCAFFVCISTSVSWSNVISFNRFDYECESPEACPPHVAYLVNFNQDGTVFSHCTGTLVGEDVLMTAAHCLPFEWNDQLCEGWTRVGLPESNQGHPVELAECKKIIGRSFSDPSYQSVTRNYPDVAFIQLDRKLERPFAQISFEGIPEGTYSIYKIDTEVRNIYPIQIFKKAECHAVMNTMINPTYSSFDSISAYFPSCLTIGGNSGSGIFNSEGNVVAVLSASAQAGGVESGPHKLYSEQKFDKKLSELESGAIASNLRCVDDSAQFTRTQNCQHPSNKAHEDINSAATQQIKDLATELVTMAFENPIDGLVLKPAFSISANTISVALEPYCMERPNPVSPFSFAPSTILHEYTFPVGEVYVDIDELGRGSVVSHFDANYTTLVLRTLFTFDTNRSPINVSLSYKREPFIAPRIGPFDKKDIEVPVCHSNLIPDEIFNVILEAIDEMEVRPLFEVP